MSTPPARASVLCGGVQTRRGGLGYAVRMLYEFLTENRQLLIERCREKVAKRFEPTEAASSINHGVPLFLEQLAETLKVEQTTSTRNFNWQHIAQGRVKLCPVNNYIR